MKSKHRHELQTNTLADYVGSQLQRAEHHVKSIALGVLAVVAIGLVLIYLVNQRSTTAGAGWSDYFDAFAQRSAESLQNVAKLHAGTPAAAWSQQAAGDMLLATGAGQMFTDREEAEKSLQDAEKCFQSVLQNAANSPTLVQRAELGLGQVFEALGDLEKARQHYDAAYRKIPDSAFGTYAKQQSDNLAQASVQDWYAWFGKQEPPKPTGADGATTPANVPDDLDTLPDRPDLSFPTGSSTTPATPAKEPPAPATEPAAPATEPAAEMPDPAPAPSPTEPVKSEP